MAEIPRVMIDAGTRALACDCSVGSMGPDTNGPYGDCPHPPPHPDEARAVLCAAFSAAKALGANALLFHDDGRVETVWLECVSVLAQEYVIETLPLSSEDEG